MLEFISITRYTMSIKNKVKACSHKDKRVLSTVVLFDGKTYGLSICEECAEKLISDDKSWKLGISGIII